MRYILLCLLQCTLFNQGMAQVNLQTGSALYNIPIFNWKDQKSRLTANLSINYNSGNGLKTNEVASNIGQGWNIVAGGVITRTQIGEPDDQKPRATNDITRYPPGYLYNTVSPEAGAPVALTRYPIYNQRNQLYKQRNDVAADRELDHFNFQFNGRSGIFVLNSSNNTGTILGDSRMLISFELEDMPNIRTTIKAFTIQDETGVIYRFKTYFNKTKVQKNAFCSADLAREQIQPKFENGKVYHESTFDDSTIVNPYIINGWYLAEIEDPLTHRKILLNYESRAINAKSGIDISYNINNNHAILSHKVSKFESYELSSIAYPDGQAVNFNYGKNRIDLAGAKELASVDIVYNGRYLSRYQFNTTYLILNRYGTPVNDFQRNAARLCLKSIVQYGVDLKAYNEPYRFDYYLGSSEEDDFVPMPFSPFKDIWGNYNGNYSLSNAGTAIDVRKSIMNMSVGELKGLCYLRDATGTTINLNPKPGYAKNGLLKQIIYPTGGTLRYEYAQNYGVLNGQYGAVNGVHVSATKVTDGGYSHTCENPLITNYNYVLEGNASSSMWGLEMPLNSITSSNHYAPELKYWKYRFPFGACSYRYQYPGIQTNEQATDFSWLQNTLITISPLLEVAGAVNSVMNAVSFINKATWGTGVGIALDVIAGLVDIVLTCFNTPTQDTTTTVYYNMDLNAANPLPAQFKRVEIAQQNGGSGKTVVEFTSDTDYSLWASTNAIGSMKQRYAYWAYGLPKKTTEYNALGTKIKESINHYDTTLAKRSFANPKFGGWGFPSCKTKINRLSSQRNTDWENQSLSYQTTSSSGMDLELEIYDVYTGRNQLVRTQERIYKTTSPTEYLESNTYYSYNGNNFQIETIRTVQSNGDNNYQDFTYNDDINTGILYTMTLNNIIGVPVVVKQSFSNAGGFFNLSEKVTEFTTLVNGDIRPLRILEQRARQPLQWPTWGSYQGPGNVANDTYFKEVKTFTYDAASNLVGIKDEGGHAVANIYDYNDKYITASIINTTSLTDKPAYTSFETDNTGGFTINGVPVYQNNAVTGIRNFLLSGNNSISASVSNTKSYRLSVWSTAGISINGGAVLVKSSPTINSYTFYEYIIPEGNTSVTVSGVASIDELRLYPVTARMRTVTYDPLIGKTAECDENNRITYFEYDELGRLRLVKDDYRNIVKMNEYNTIKNPAGCIASYSNLTIREIFTRNNCGSGYAGGDVIYTIPAGKYTSTKSQEEVDEQVQKELNTVAQAYANSNGACIQLYYNTEQTLSFTPETCPIGYTDNDIVYTVPAGIYTSRISQADADLQALNEVKANGQNYANTHANCSINLDPVWEAEETAPTQCETSGGNNTGNLLVYCRDINPNSVTYNTYEWKNMGADNGGLCPPQNTAVSVVGTNYTSATFEITFINTTNSQTYTFTLVDGRNGSIIGSVPQGTYDITITPVSNYGSGSFFYILNDTFYYSGTGSITWTGVYAGLTTIEIN